MDNLSRKATLSKVFLFNHSNLESVILGNNVLSVGANYFVLEHSRLQNRLDVSKSKQKIIKVVSLVNSCGKFTKYTHSS